MAHVPERFMREILWPEFQELNRTLTAYLGEVTRRVIEKAVATIARTSRSPCLRRVLPRESSGGSFNLRRSPLFGLKNS